MSRLTAVTLQWVVVPDCVTCGGRHLTVGGGDCVTSDGRHLTVGGGA